MRRGAQRTLHSVLVAALTLAFAPLSDTLFAIIGLGLFFTAQVLADRKNNHILRKNMLQYLRGPDSPYPELRNTLDG